MEQNQGAIGREDPGLMVVPAQEVEATEAVMEGAMVEGTQEAEATEGAVPMEGDTVVVTMEGNIKEMIENGDRFDLGCVYEV